MLHKISKTEYDNYIDFVYGLSADLSCCAFPIYTDGVKTKETFCSQSLQGLKNDSEEILLFSQEGKVEGWIHYYFIEADKYLGIGGMFIKNNFQTALSELLDYWNGKYAGYSWGIYFPRENKNALSFMKQCGFEEQSQEIVDVLLFTDYTARPSSPKVVPVDCENFEIFADIHSRFESGMYWTCGRIRKTLEQWKIFAFLENGRCLGVLYYMRADGKDLEIFGIDYADGTCDLHAAEGLLVNALNEVKEENARSMYYFSDKTTCETAERLGFRRVTTAYYFEGICGPSNFKNDLLSNKVVV